MTPSGVNYLRRKRRETGYEQKRERLRHGDPVRSSLQHELLRIISNRQEEKWRDVLEQYRATQRGD